MEITIPKIFKNKTVTIVGGGISLDNFDFGRISGSVVTVNNACYFVQSDVLVSIDAAWHTRNGEFLKQYEGYLVTDRETRRNDAHIIKYHEGHKHECEYDWHMKKGNLSGFVALGLTLFLGASKIYLLGFDGGFAGDKANFYENAQASNESGYSDKNSYYDYFKDENIINVGLGSKINSFKKIALDQYGI